MATRQAYVHVGLPLSGADHLGNALSHHGAPLAELGLRQPAKSEAEMFRAALEICRDHKAWGLRRRDVEGAWSGVCRRAHRDKGTVFVGHERMGHRVSPRSS